MFDEKTITACILPLAQFAQAFDPSYDAIDTRLTESLTGRTVQGTYSLCSIDNLKNSAPEFKQYNYPAWATGVAIKQYVVVKYLDILYFSKVAISAMDNTVDPLASANYEATNPFNQWLYELKYQAAIELVSALMRNRKLQQTSKTLLDNTRLYEDGGLLNNRIINRSAFVGFAFELKPNENLVNYINQVGIQLDSDLETLNLYLFHSSVSQPLATITINAIGGLVYKWTELNPAVSFKSHDYAAETGHDVGGRFFLGYYQADLGSSQAIRKDFNISRQPCVTCSSYNLQAYRKWNKFISASAIRVDFENLRSGGPLLWDLDYTEYTNDTNWGLNLSISVRCEVSNFICNNATLFADAYVKMIAIKCAEVMANSTRINGISSTVKGLAASELDPKKGSGSLRDQYNQCMDALDFDVSGFDENCLACNDKGKIYWGDSI